MPNPTRALLAAAAALAAAGCTAEPAESIAPSMDGPSQSATVAASATSAASLTLVGHAPVITGELLPDGHPWTLPAAFTFADGEYHAWVVGFADEPGEQQPYHLTSADAVTWAVGDADLPSELGIEYTQPGPIPSDVIANDDGTWVMHFWGTESPENDRADIWRATSTDPDGPWRADPEPALPHGDIDAWDGRGVDFPSVARTDDGYLMLHGGAAFGSQPAGAMGVATSTDGVAWTKREQPVIAPGFCGDFDRVNASQGRLLPMADGGYLLPYGGYAGGDIGATIGLATSPDGISWTCVTPEPILVAADIPGSTGIHSMAATVGSDGRPLLLVESLLADGAGSEVWLARIDLP